MDEVEKVMQSMSFEFFGSGKHKIEMEELLATKDAIFLDVRSAPEVESIQLRLEHHIRVLWIPMDEIPARLNEIPRDKTIGAFCSAGTRSTMAYMYLRSKGYDNVRIAPSNYDAITSLLLPGKLFKHLDKSKPA
ncbi:MAG: rhodanese-like domain-containing protein [Armatimonadota bacterium]